MITIAFAEAPFDWVSDMFRGLRGVMLDMYRQPDKLKATIDLFTDFAIQSAIMGGCRCRGTHGYSSPCIAGRVDSCPTSNSLSFTGLASRH